MVYQALPILILILKQCLWNMSGHENFLCNLRYVIYGEPFCTYLCWKLQRMIHISREVDVLIHTVIAKNTIVTKHACYDLFAILSQADSIALYTYIVILLLDQSEGENVVWHTVYEHSMSSIFHKIVFISFSFTAVKQHGRMYVIYVQYLYNLR